MKHSRRKNKITGSGVAKIILSALLVLTLVLAAVMYLREQVESEYAADERKEAVSAVVTRGSISTSVYGSGRLYDEDEETFTIPGEVELEQIYVQPGDKVSQGDLFASVNLNSVLTAMNALSEEIAALDTEINSASIQSAYGYISSAVSGRVKMIYADKGERVADIMREHGALMLLSLDGYMAMDVDIGQAQLSVGDAVTLTGESGLSYPGRVAELLNGVATVLITDQGTVFGERMSLINAAGETLGHGTLYINQPLKIMGYTGTVDYINVRDNSVVYEGSTLISLSDMDNSAKYEGLLRERAGLEEEMSRLINIYRDGAIYFELSGTVKAVSASDAEDRAQAEADAAAGSAESTTHTENAAEYYTISPDRSMSVSLSVDETDILSLSPGQKATVSIDALGDESFEGSVTEIDRIGTSSSGVTSYTTLVTIEKTESMLAGMSASASIRIDGIENALLIPVAALNKTSSSYYVYTALAGDGSLTGMKEVSVGIANADHVEIIEGLSEGDTVYYHEAEEQFSSLSAMGAVPGGSMGAMPGGNMGAMPGGNMGAMPGGNMGSMGAVPGGR